MVRQASKYEQATHLVLYTSRHRPNHPPNRLPPAPPSPLLLASFRIHVLRSSLFLSSSNLVIRVSICGSARLNASNVGIELIYRHDRISICTTSSQSHTRTPISAFLCPPRFPYALPPSHTTTHHKPNPHIPNRHRIQLHLRIPHAPLLLSHPLLFNQLPQYRRNLAARRTPRRGP